MENIEILGKKEQIKRESVFCFGTAVAVAVMLMVLVLPTTVKETSMQPAIDPEDHLIVSRQAYTIGHVQRGDIIVFKSDLKDENTGKKKYLIKRVIGVPGDIITIANGNVYINGSKVRESYIGEERTDGDIHNLKVGEDELFVMGDHRSVSRDSRLMGCIKQSRIKGKAVFRYSPLSKFGRI